MSVSARWTSIGVRQCIVRRHFSSSVTLGTYALSTKQWCSALLDVEYVDIERLF